MSKIGITILLFICIIYGNAQNPNVSMNYRLVIHGGAGTILKKNMSDELEAAYKKNLKEALKAGYTILSKGGSSLDAVETAIRIMEDSPLFNAGKGAVFTAQGKNEMDASIMDGRDMKAGAVAGVSSVRNPISAARKVMEETPHVMLSGEGADKFAIEQGLKTESPKYFYTERRWKHLQKIKDSEKIEMDHSDEKGMLEMLENNKFGTVGAVALDQAGNVAAATSTGGMTNKKFGRIGDSPIIGAGTYASNKTCAISCTGHGEFFMRGVVAYDVAAQMEYKKSSLAESAHNVIHKKLLEIGGLGGLIGIDASGNYVMEFNTPGMYRGQIGADGEPEVFIYK